MRTRETVPVEYANTLANMANFLWNLPDDPARLANGNQRNLTTARNHYAEARQIFMLHGELEKARIVSEGIRPDRA